MEKIKMIIAIDTETKGLNTSENNFILGVITFEDHKQETYYTRKEMWKRIIEIGNKQKKERKKLYCYHHGDYDSRVLYDPTDEKVKEYCLAPLIIQRDNIEFINTQQLFRTSLAEIGEMIQLEKQEIDIENFLNDKWIKENKEIIEKYCARDSLIVMKLMQKLKEILKEDNIKPRAIRTMANLGLNYIMRELKKEPKEELFYNTQKPYQGFHFTNNKEHIHKAYRGAIINAYKTGTYENTYQIDYNSLYPDCISNIEIPDLRTEQHMIAPNKKILDYIGVSTCLIDTRKVKIPLLQTRLYWEELEREEYTNHGLIYGTWTNLELKKAQEIGYDIKYIDEATIYGNKLETNPLKKIFKEMYSKRLEDKTKKRLYKGMMNQAIGKLAQRRKNMEIKWDDSWKLYELATEGYNVLQEGKDRHKYIKFTEYQYRRDYCPIIPTYVNALGRIKLWEAINKVGIENVLYVDTDSILMQGNHMNKLELGNQIGQWSIEKENATSLIYGRKMYSIDNQIKLKGVPKKYITKEGFEKGKLKYERNKRINKTNVKQNTIELEEIELNLQKSQQQEQKRQKEIKSRDYIIDTLEKIGEGKQKHIETFI